VEAPRPEPERTRPATEREDVHVHAHGDDERRCPYCHEAMADGALAGACEGCGTLHHLGCFAEHGGCSTHGCGATRARTERVGEPGRPRFAPLVCGACRAALAPDEIVARCTSCRGVQHVACYEAAGACRRPFGSCGASTIVLLSHAEAVAQTRRVLAWVLGLTGALIALLFGALAGAVAADPGPYDGGPLVAAATLAGIGLSLAVAGLVVGVRAKRLVPPPPGRTRPAKPAAKPADPGPPGAALDP
jgi:hypothetical protein